MKLLSLRLLRPFSLTAQSHLLSSVNSIRNSSHYEVLRVTKTAKPAHIKEAYIKLCKEFHPDVNTDPEAVVKFRLKILRITGKHVQFFTIVHATKNPHMHVNME